MGWRSPGGVAGVFWHQRPRCLGYVALLCAAAERRKWQDRASAICDELGAFRFRQFGREWPPGQPCRMYSMAGEGYSRFADYLTQIIHPEREMSSPLVSVRDRS